MRASSCCKSNSAGGSRFSSRLVNWIKRCWKNFLARFTSSPLICRPVNTSGLTWGLTTTLTGSRTTGNTFVGTSTLVGVTTDATSLAGPAEPPAHRPA